MKYSFPRELRLVTKNQFKKVFSETQRKIVTKEFALYFCFNNFTCPRLGVIVPKKNVNKASERNCFKRIIREQFRLNRYKFKNIDIVILVNKTKKNLVKIELRESLEKQFNKIVSLTK